MSYGRETLAVARKSFVPGKVGTPDEQIHYFDDDLSWEREIEEFVDCMQNDRPVRVGTSEDAMKVMELIRRIYQADPSWTTRFKGEKL